MPDKDVHIWGYIGAMLGSTFAALGFQKFMFKHQNQKISDVCKTLAAKQDKDNCGLMSKHLEDKIDGIIYSVDKMNDTQTKMIIEIAVLNNGRKRVVDV